MNISELRQQLETKSKALAGFEIGDTLTIEKEAEFTALEKDVNDIVGKIETLERIEKTKLETAERIEKIATPSISGTVYAEPLVKESKLFKDDKDAHAFGEYIRTKGAKDELFKERFGRELTQKTSTTGDSFNAGFLVTPPSVSRTIVAVAEQHGVALREVNVQNMTSLIEDVVVINDDDIRMYYVGEGVAPTETDISVGKSRLVAKKAAGSTAVSDELFNHSSVNIADTLVTAFGKAYARMADEAVFSNTGILNSDQGGTVSIPSALVTLNSSSSLQGTGAWSAITVPNLRLFLSLLPDVNGAKLYMSRQAKALIFERLSDAANGNTGAFYTDSGSMRWGGFEIVEVNKLATADTNPSNIALFGNLRNACTLGIADAFRMQMNTEILQKEGLVQFNFKAMHDVCTYNLGTASKAGAVALLRRNS
jgi:HK97 family phage major capsid protein